MPVVDRRGRAGEIVDFVHLYIEREGDVVAQEFEARMADEMLDVALLAGEEIIDADDLMADLEQAVAQMRAEKAGAASHKDFRSNTRV